MRVQMFMTRVSVEVTSKLFAMALLFTINAKRKEKVPKPTIPLDWHF